MIRAAWKASGLNGRHWSYASNAREDWKISSVQKWAGDAHFDLRFHFDGLEQWIPAELRDAPEGETHEQARVRVKKIVKAIRLARGLSSLEMDRRLDQQYCVYYAWESRLTDFQLAAVQRSVRALGGVFRMELEHRHNPGLLKRINRKK